MVKQAECFLDANKYLVHRTGIAFLAHSPLNKTEHVPLQKLLEI